MGMLYLAVCVSYTKISTFPRCHVSICVPPTRRLKTINDLSRHLDDVTKHFRNCRQFKDWPVIRHLSLFPACEEMGFIYRAHHVQ